LLTIPAWIRIIFCQGPRQVINALTLYSVFRAKLDPTNTNDVGSTLLGFFKNIGILAQQQHQQAVILSGMTFTLVIWIFGALSLLLAVLFYVFFLWHYIPNADGGLSGYCERKVNRRLAKIVSVKVNKAIEEEERKRIKADAKAVKKGEMPAFGRQATLPTLFDPKSDDKLPGMPMLNRNDTMTTLPQYSSRPGTPSGQPTIPGFELDQLDQKRPYPNRSVTGSSAVSGQSFGSNAPLMGNASDIGYGRAASPAPSLPPLDTNGFPRAPQRTMTADSQNSNWSRGPQQGPPRMPSAMGDRGYTQSPVSYGESPRSQAQPSMDNFGRPMPRAVDELRSNSLSSQQGPPGRRNPYDQNYPGGRSSPASGSEFGRNSPAPYQARGPAPAGSEYGRNSPAPIQTRGPGSEYGRNSPAPSQGGRGPTSPTSSNGGYQPYNPGNRSASSASPNNPNFPPRQPQYRNMTDPGPRGPPQDGDYFGNVNAPPMPRPGTGQSNRSGGGSGSGPSIARLASPAPYNGGGTQSPAFGGSTGNPMYRR
jgi:hypothetical protein